MRSQWFKKTLGLLQIFDNERVSLKCAMDEALFA
jgi:hypothetical protein